MNGKSLISGLFLSAALVGCNETDVQDVVGDGSPSGSSGQVAEPVGSSGSGSSDSGSSDSGSSDSGMSGGMMDMPCTHPGNCPGDFPAERAVNSGSATFDVSQTGEMPYADGEPVGAFRTVCDVSHFAYADPIVFPGQSKVGHLHMFFGNTGANGQSTYESLRNSGNGTCRGGIANRSAYWVPALLDGSGNPQLPKVINVYYKSGYKINNPRDVSVIPDGFRMLVGDSMATAPQNPNGNSYDKNVWWECNGVKSDSIGDCYGTLKMAVEFNQCTNGQLDSLDHKSHVKRASDGACNESGYSITLPEISYNIEFAVNGTSDWYVSSDTYSISNGNGGYSLHGDWMDGWDPDVKRSWTEACSANPGMSCGSHIIGGGNVIH